MKTLKFKILFFLIFSLAICVNEQIVDVAYGSDGTQPRFQRADSGSYYIPELSGLPNVNGVALANFDNDPNNLIDIYIPLKWMFYQENPGVFREEDILPTEDHRLNYSHCAAADYDNDGDIEIAVGTMGASSAMGFNKLFDRVGNSYIDKAETARITSDGMNDHVAWLDYNGDGYLDLIFGEGPETITGRDGMLYKNLGPTGNYNFKDVTDDPAELAIDNGSTPKTLADYMEGLASSKIIIGDYDNDGDEDFIINREYSEESIFLKNRHKQGLKTFERVDIGTLLGAYAMGGIFFDADNDGDLDLIQVNMRPCGSNNSTIFYLENQGLPNYTFIDKTAEANLIYQGSVNTVTYGDYDKDGDFDVLISFDKRFPATPAWVRLYENDGNGRFSDVTDSVGFGSYGSEGGNFLSIAFVDIDNDGDLDIFNTAWVGESSLWLNSGNSNNWIGIELIGSISNIHGFGAKVKVTAGNIAGDNFVAGDITMIQEMPARGGYDTGNVIPLFFGLRGYTAAEVEIIWPSGLKQELLLSETQINQNVIIEELWQKHDLGEFLDTSGNLHTLGLSDAELQTFIDNIKALVVVGGGAKEVSPGVLSTDNFYFDNIAGLNRGDLLFLSEYIGGYNQCLVYARPDPHQVRIDNLGILQPYNIGAMSWDEWGNKQWEGYLGVTDDGPGRNDYLIYGFKEDADIRAREVELGLSVGALDRFEIDPETIYDRTNSPYANPIPDTSGEDLLDIAILPNGDFLYIYSKNDSGNFIYYIDRSRGGVVTFAVDTLAELFEWRHGVNAPDFNQPIKAIAYEISRGYLSGSVHPWPLWLVVQDDYIYLYLGDAPGATLPQGDTISETVYFRITPKPDLASTLIKIASPTGKIYEGASVIFNSGISNKGGSYAGTFNVRWLVDGKEAMRSSCSDIERGKTINSQFKWTAPQASQPTHSHTITFVVDYDNQVNESDENNNEVSITVTVENKNYELYKIYLGYQQSYASKSDAYSQALSKLYYGYAYYYYYLYYSERYKNYYKTLYPSSATYYDALSLYYERIAKYHLYLGLYEFYKYYYQKYNHSYYQTLYARYYNMAWYNYYIGLADLYAYYATRYPTYASYYNQLSTQYRLYAAQYE